MKLEPLGSCIGVSVTDIESADLVDPAVGAALLDALETYGDTLQKAKEAGTFLAATTYFADGIDTSHAPPELQAKAAEVFPKARPTIGRALGLGLKVCCGTDAPAIPHGKNAKELLALVDRGASPLRALQTATIAAAELIDVDDRGRLEPGLLADVIAVTGDPFSDIGVTESVEFVMLGGEIYRTPRGAV